MGNDDIQTLEPKQFPPLLREITDPPKQLRVRGKLPGEELKFLCVVGSRRFTNYGKAACEKLISGLAGYPVVIVSGLALGTDGIAHKAALHSGLKTVAVPGSGLDWSVLHPKTNHSIAREILASGGALITEYSDDTKPALWTFPKRNRIMIGLSHAVLITEAEPRSGTLISARLATEYNRDVLVVPGSILSNTSVGTNSLLRDGAAPVTESADILRALGLDVTEKPKQERLEHLSDKEKQVISILERPMARDDLLQRLKMPTHEANVLLSAMELKGLIKEELGNVRIT